MSFQPGTSQPMLSIGVPDTANKHGERIAQVIDKTTLEPRSNAFSNLPLGVPDKRGRVRETSELTNHPSKLAKLEDGRTAVGQNTPGPSGFGPSPVIGTGSVPYNEVPGSEGVHNSEKQFNQLQLEPEIESALLQQVMALTSEQLSVLTPEQRQQVIQLQQRLR
ncbi:hypothetical protein GIB67_022609 [Kingdonia uniflora]|uniref:Transcription termination and cleavage factor C-terminal domain-containing protein n=1 Tax=Kingdonia uniflora TaxID=39325 RepID=A0A7J7P851_9MAGN|nr:hypothetical protein GIB67_022609 [Kingdonia uniflora]